MMNFLLFATLLCLPLAESCEKERKLPEKAPAQWTRYQTDLVVRSNCLKRNILYSVFLPADYETATDKRYDVVYLLHGLGDDHGSWNGKYMHISTTLQQLENRGTIAPKIYVMPQGFNSYYVNAYDGSFDYMDFFVEEFIPFIDGNYRTIAERGHRAIAGYSMGGFGAMVMAAKNPDLFIATIPLSMSLCQYERYTTEASNSDGWDKQWGWIFGGVGSKGDARITDYYKEHCPYYYFTEASAPSFAKMHWWLDCGDDEQQLLIANDRVHRQMRDLGIKHEFRVRNGAHTTDYWRSAMESALPWLETLLDGGQYPDTETANVDTGSFEGRTEELTVGGCTVKIYLSQKYDPEAERENTLLLAGHDGYTDKELNGIANALTLATYSRPCVLACLDTSSESVDLDAVTAALAEKYRIGGSAYRIGLGFGEGADRLWRYSADDIEATDNEGKTTAAGVLGSLFLIDGNADASACNPNGKTFYYIVTTDEGTHYRSAGEMYELCKKKGTPHEYRVRNGASGYDAVLACFAATVSDIKTKIKN